MAIYIGVVRKLDADYVYADLTVVVSDEDEDEDEDEDKCVPIPLKLFPQADRPLLKIGQKFYWRFL